MIVDDSSLGRQIRRLAGCCRLLPKQSRPTPTSVVVVVVAVAVVAPLPTLLIVRPTPEFRRRANRSSSSSAGSAAQGHDSTATPESLRALDEPWLPF